MEYNCCLIFNGVLLMSNAGLAKLAGCAGRRAPGNLRTAIGRRYPCPLESGVAAMAMRMHPRE
jgi:hypothetical protein